ncbi:MAG TPA: NUDIX domain-containing protein [Pyrinomonadaceae bacterium]|jgi:8-oxo-dGTP pyrophosphatase MutT (NUDIX family)|nr:NUDIX domain-containing protein [Pyrinomonadaceae bacterium]
MTNQPTHAGAVVFRKRGTQVQYLIVSSSDGINWVVPKGHIDPGETPEIAALRELAEEAGVLGEIVASLSARDFVKTGKAARVQFFLVRETGTTDSSENRTIRWENESAARQVLTFAEAREALNEGATIVNRMDSQK